MRRAHERYDAAPAPEPGKESPSADDEADPGTNAEDKGEAGEDHPER